MPCVPAPSKEKGEAGGAGAEGQATGVREEHGKGWGSAGLATGEVRREGGQSCSW